MDCKKLTMALTLTIIITFSIQSVDATSEYLPQWTNGLYTWYDEELITDSEFINAIEYLNVSKVSPLLTPSSSQVSPLLTPSSSQVPLMEVNCITFDDMLKYSDGTTIFNGELIVCDENKPIVYDSDYYYNGYISGDLTLAETNAGLERIAEKVYDNYLRYGYISNLDVQAPP